MIFRLSQKLNTKVKAGTLPELPFDENPFVDWSANLFYADRTQYVLLTNTKSLYSTVFFGKGITDESELINRALSSLREFMQADGQEFIFRRLIAPAAATVQFAKALNRSVIGSMNELVRFAKFMLIEHEMSTVEVGAKLNDIPHSSLKYFKPREAFKQLASSIEP